jgi:hypothetical protein
LAAMIGEPASDLLSIRRKRRHPKHSRDAPIRLDFARTIRI